MELIKFLPNSAVDYINCFRTLAALTDSALNYIERDNYRASENDRTRSLARVAESVETLASLRGDHAAYYDARPSGLTEYQKEMYAIENQLRDRLVSLGYEYPAYS